MIIIQFHLHGKSDVILYCFYSVYRKILILQNKANLSQNPSTLKQHETMSSKLNKPLWLPKSLIPPQQSHFASDKWHTDSFNRGQFGAIRSNSGNSEVSDAWPNPLTQLHRPPRYALLGNVWQLIKSQSCRAHRKLRSSLGASDLFYNELDLRRISLI